MNDIVVPSARNVSFNSQYNFKVTTLFYLFRVGRAFSATKMFNYENRQMASDFKVFTSINHVRFAHSWVLKKNQKTTHHSTQTSTNNVNRTWAIPQTTGGKDESKIVFMQKSQRTSQHWTQHVKTDNRTIQNTKQISNTDPTKQPGMNSCAREGQADPASY